jgi:hypothetical protein
MISDLKSLPRVKCTDNLISRVGISISDLHNYILDHISENVSEQIITIRNSSRKISSSVKLSLSQIKSCDFVFRNVNGIFSVKLCYSSNVSVLLVDLLYFFHRQVYRPPHSYKDMCVLQGINKCSIALSLKVTIC